MPASSPLLIIDADAQRRAETGCWLGDAGFQVTGVATVDDAASGVPPEAPELILIEVGGGTAAAIAMLRACRSWLKGQRAEVLLVTGPGADISAGEVLAAGADDMARRPLAAEELVTRVRLHLRARELSRANDDLTRGMALKRIAGRAAHLGGWSLELASNELVWSEEICAIHDQPVGYQPTLKEAIEYYPPEIREWVAATVDRCCRDGTPFDFETKIVTAKERTLTIRALGEAVRDVEGNIVRIQGAFQDITARKQTEQSLADSRHQFRQLTDAIPFIFWTALPHGTIDFSNRQFNLYTGVPESAPPATRWQPCVHPDDLPEVMSRWASCVEQETLFEAEYRLRRGSDGAYRWFHVQAKPIRNTDGQVHTWYGTGIDVHETRQLREDTERTADRLTATLESITDAFFTLDQDWNISYLNMEAQRLVQKSRKEVLGRTIWQVFPETLGGPFEENYRRAVRERVTVSFEAFYSPLKTWFQVRAYPSNEGLAVYYRDVTERRRNRDSLLESERRFRSVVESSPDAIFIHVQRRIVYANPAALQLFGADSEQVLLGIDILDLVSPKQRAEVAERIDRLNLEREAVPAAKRQMMRLSGEVRHTLVSGIPFEYRGEKGALIFATDITARKEAELALREQAELLNLAQDAIIVRNLDHTIRYWNRSAEKLYGWTAAEAVGRSVRDLLYRDSTTFLAATRATCETGEWMGEIEQWSKSENRIVVEGRWTLVRDEAGHPTSILAINTDIGERKKLEAQIFRAQRMESIGTLAGGIAHDLNNLLAPIMMGVDLLDRHVASNPKATALCGEMKRSAKRGADLVKQVLSFARGVEGERVVVRLDELVREVESMIKNTFPRNIRLVVAGEVDLPAVIGDPTQLNQILVNLCVNARDAMPHGGRLRIRLRVTMIDQQYAIMNQNVSPGRYAVIEVTDDGMGMNRATVDRIFDPFFTTKEIGEGTGLGLSTVLSITRSHGGFINVYSEPGRGSTFRIYLPVDDRSAEERAVVEEPSATELPRGQDELILVVDDEASILTITQQTLEAHGYRVLTAEDGAQAIAVFARHRGNIAAVLTDMMMPVMDGATLIAALRRLEPDLCIIAASGLNSHWGVAKAGKAGVAHFLDKPYTADRLLRTLRRELDGKRG